MAFLYRTMCI